MIHSNPPVALLAMPSSRQVRPRPADVLNDRIDHLDQWREAAGHFLANLNNWPRDRSPAVEPTVAFLRVCLTPPLHPLLDSFQRDISLYEATSQSLRTFLSDKGRSESLAALDGYVRTFYDDLAGVLGAVLLFARADYLSLEGVHANARVTLAGLSGFYRTDRGWYRGRYTTHFNKLLEVGLLTGAPLTTRPREPFLA